MAEESALEKAKRLKQEQDALKRKILFIPCRSKEALHKWIQLFLGLDIPDCIVDPDSNCSPMDMIYECYSKAMANDDPMFNRVLYYASRDSFKTLGAAILELLAVVHLQRDVAHMAAIEAQSRKSQQYVKKFFSKPILRDYVSGDNLEIMWVVRYYNKLTGENITEDAWKVLPKDAKDDYEEIRHFIHIVICTMAGANSEHVPFFVVDEVDVVRDPRAYEEAKLIPAPINGLMPITLLTSTRKISTGLVQKEIDDEFDPETHRRRLWIRHWNIIDVTAKCPPERHLPLLPKIPIYVNENQVRAISEAKYNDLSPQEQSKFKKEEGFQGCLQNCRLFAACHGLLATKQKSNSALLKPIEHTTNQIVNVSAPTALAQLLCKKPSQEGLIYPNFERSTHMLTPAQMAAKVMGTPFPENFTKRQLIELFRQRDLLCYAGMDFGYEHNFAVVTFFVDGYRAFVVDVISEAELLPDAQVAICTSRIKKWMPTIFADPESPQMVALFRKHGFRMRDWVKGPGSVYGGINIVHMRLRPPASEEPLIFFLAGDPGVEVLIKRMVKYHWKRDAADRPTNKPSDEEDDECDAFRYGIMNVFSPERGRVQAAEDAPEEPGEAPPGVYTVENWMSRVIEEAGAHTSEEAAGLMARRGRFIAIT